MVIPEAAVEAAANDLYDREGYSTSLADAPQYRKSRFLTLAREVLEAAAPHMLGEAWAQGAQEGFESTAEGFNGECAFDHCAPDNYPPTNPYSGTKWEVQDYTP